MAPSTADAATSGGVDSTATEATVLGAAVRRVAARMRLRVALRGAERAAWAIGMAALPVVAAVRLGWIGHLRAAVIAMGAGLLAMLAVVWRARPVRALDAAAAADHALALSDRLVSAVSFLAEPAPTPLMRLAIADGAQVGAGIDPRGVVRLDLPRSARALPLLAIAIGLLTLLRPPQHAALAPPTTLRPRLVVEEDALVAERETLRKLAAEAKGHDPELAQLAQALDGVLRQIDQHQLTRAEAFAQLAALEAKLADARSTMPPKPTEALAALQKALASSKATQAMAEALKRDDLKAAQQELERLANEAQARQEAKGTDAKRDEAQAELARALDRASRAIDEAQQKADAERDRRIEALQEEERRLKKQKQEHPEDQETERKLQRNQRELERLERERQAQQEQRRQLQRLSRELEKAAEQLRSKMSPEAMKRAAEALAKMEDEIRKLGSSAQAMVQIGELKEVLRRAGHVEQGDGPGQAPRKGNGKQGGGGAGDERAQRLQEFDERAGGEANALLLGGDDPGQGAAMLPLPMGESPGGGREPGREPGDGHGNPDKPPGDGIGHEHDPNLLGDRTALKAQQKLIRAHGQAGAGPSKSQTILGAAERGFSSRDYQRVYKDYSAVVEEVMSQEGVPPGYRYYVKRYFELIRPRE